MSTTLPWGVLDVRFVEVRLELTLTSNKLLTSMVGTFEYDVIVAGELLNVYERICCYLKGVSRRMRS